MTDRYDEAMSFFTRNLTEIKPPESNLPAWNLSTGLQLLAEAIQQDMAELKRRIAAIESGVRGPK